MAIKESAVRVGNQDRKASVVNLGSRVRVGNQDRKASVVNRARKVRLANRAHRLQLGNRAMSRKKRIGKTRPDSANMNSIWPTKRRYSTFGLRL